MSSSASRIAAVAVTSPVVCTRTFTEVSIGCGTEYPARLTCGFLFSMYRSVFPIVWSSSFSMNVFSYTEAMARPRPPPPRMALRRAKELSIWIFFPEQRALFLKWINA